MIILDNKNIILATVWGSLLLIDEVRYTWGEEFYLVV